MGTVKEVDEGFEVQEGLLYHVNKEGVRQLAVPQKWRGSILKLAHNVPMARHLSTQKMTSRVMQRFWWPNINREVEEYCKMYSLRLSRAGSDGCGFFGLFGHVLKVVLPDISPVSVASIFRGLE